MKTRDGVVVSAKMTRTVVVQLERLVRHPRYKKYVRQRTRVAARDELSCVEGDVVTIATTRPLSRSVRWRVLRVVGRRAVGGAGEEAGQPVSVPGEVRT